MKHLRVLVVGVTALVATMQEARGQVVISGGPGPGIGISISSRKLSASLFLPYGGPSGPGSGPFIGPPPYAYGPSGPFGVTNINSNVTFYQPTPIGIPVPRELLSQPSMEDLPTPIISRSSFRDEDFPDKIIVRPGQRTIPSRTRPPDGPPRPVVPDDRPRPGLQEPPARPVPPPVPPPPPEINPPRPSAPDADPKKEYSRQVSLGKEAFNDEEYGRAASRFQQAIKLQPKQPLAHFLLAQAQLALGKYQEAVASIHDGLRLQPAWPSARFRPRELYGEDAQPYNEHLRTLQGALRRNPDDGVLLFLMAYQLWFDGREDSARPLFRKAAKLVRNPRFIDLFLNAQQGMQVVKGELNL